MEHSEQIFALALGIEQPWNIKEIIFDKNTSRLDIHLEFTRGYKFNSEDGNSYTAHDTVERTWQHLNFFQHHCYLHAKVPRIKQKDGRIKTQPVPWARKGSGFSLLFEAYVMLLIENEMPLNKVGTVLNVYPKRLWTIFNYWISRAHKSDVIANVTKIGFDETSVKKGHNYVTTMVDIEERRVLFVTEGKGSLCIKNSVDYLESKQVDINSIEQVCIDMSPSFISGCTEYLPDTPITFDRFHVMKDINKAMDEVRKLERVGNEVIKKHRYTFLKNKISRSLQVKRDSLMELYPTLGEAYRLKCLFRDF